MLWYLNSILLDSRPLLVYKYRIRRSACRYESVEKKKKKKQKEQRKKPKEKTVKSK